MKPGFSLKHAHGRVWVLRLANVSIVCYYTIIKPKGRRNRMAKILKARKSTIALVTFGLLATGIAVAEANGTWRDPVYHTVSDKYSIAQESFGSHL